MRHDHFAFTRRTAYVLLALGLGAANAPAQTCYSSICFSSGDVSFADAYLVYDPLHSGLCGPTNGNFTNPASALGHPDYTGGSTGVGSVALGQGGRLEVAFVDNLLINSGTTVTDVHIFEVGPAVEVCVVALRPANLLTQARLLGAGLLDANGDGFFEAGQIGGSVASVDIDAWAPGFAQGDLLFDAVQIVDDPLQTPGCGGTPGADIDAVGATSTMVLPPLATQVCAGQVNSTGVPGTMNAFGSPNAALDFLSLLAEHLPPGSFGYFLVSRQSGPPVMPPFSQGQLCLGGAIGRYVGSGQVQRAGLSGTIGLGLVLSSTPQPTGPVAVMAGELWHYQCWYRDAVGGQATSNFTGAVAMQFL